MGGGNENDDKDEQVYEYFDTLFPNNKYFTIVKQYFNNTEMSRKILE